MEEISQIISIISIIISIVAIFVSTKAWHKNRVVYGIEREVLRQFDGTKNDLDINENKKLSEKMSSGNYVVLSFLERKADKDWEVMLGRIMPY